MGTCALGRAGGFAHSGELVSKLLGKFAASRTCHMEPISLGGVLRISKGSVGPECELPEPANVAEKEVSQMKTSSIDREFGRQAFGVDPQGYHTVRPAYPEWVFETLRDRCGLAHDAATFEIGAGTGTATRSLLDYGAAPLVAVEPDERMADFLRRTISDKALSVIVSPFEDATLPDNSFGLGVSATAFHWLNEERALAKVASLLRPGGWWAMVWNVFGDRDRPDPFHEATKALLEGPVSPSAGSGGLPFALDTDARLSALERNHAFDSIEHFTGSWSLVLNPDQVVALYATYSNVNIRPDRAAVLTELERIARDEFHGSVTRNMITKLYIARRRP